MKRALLCILAGLYGCGEITNEDLVFLAAVPTSEELAIVVDEQMAAASAQTLQLKSAQELGEPSGTYLNLSSLATELNSHVDFILDFVDDLGRGVAPTLREDDRRVWGPFHENGGPAIRLEIAREFRDEVPVYTYCLHVARPGETNGDPQCSPDRAVTDNSNGWRAYLYGAFTPLNVIQWARTGQGVFTLDFEAARAVDALENPGDEGRFSVEYDFAEGGEAKDLEVTFTPRFEEIAGIEDYFWAYSLTREGRVRFYVEFSENAENTSPENRELLQIDSCWELDGPGRANFTLSEGDIPPSTSAQGLECWDAERNRSYAAVRINDITMELGNAEDCPPACQ